MFSALQFSGPIFKLYQNINKLSLKHALQTGTEINLSAMKVSKVLLCTSLQITMSIIQGMRTYKIVFLFWGIYNWTLQIKKKKRHSHVFVDLLYVFFLLSFMLVFIFYLFILIGG